MNFDVERLPLEYALEIKLSQIGVPLNKRISGEELERLASEDDDVNKMLGVITRDDVKNMKPDEALVASIMGLSDLQRELLYDKEDLGFEILFRRIGYSKPWKIEYEAAYNLDDSKINEMVCLDYDDSPFMMWSDGYTDGTTLVDIALPKKELKRLPREIQKILQYARVLDKNPFNPEVISDEVVKFLKIPKDRIL